MRVALSAILTFLGCAIVCFVLAYLSACSTLHVQVDCWHRPHDEPLTLDACHGKQLHLTWRF